MTLPLPFPFSCEIPFVFFFFFGFASPSSSLRTRFPMTLADGAGVSGRRFPAATLIAAGIVHLRLSVGGKVCCAGGIGVPVISGNCANGVETNLYRHFGRPGARSTIHRPVLCASCTSIVSTVLTKSQLCFPVSQCLHFVNFVWDVRSHCPSREHPRQLLHGGYDVSLVSSIMTTGYYSHCSILTWTLLLRALMLHPLLARVVFFHLVPSCIVDLMVVRGFHCGEGKGF